MRKWLGGLLWLGVGLCGTGVAPIACMTHVCTMVGCDDSEQLAFSATVAQVSDTNVSACRNARCWHGSIAASDLTASAAYRWLRLAADDGSNARVQCTIDPPLPDSTVRLTITWDSPDSPVVAGDVLSATFRDASGSTVFSTKGTIRSFKEYYPNGKDCDDVPCRAGAVEGRAD
ncbi:MAG TPA: hypothetical protein VHM25_16875 [Polyangiaceae bacterium]|nr:hypothetical protein [Polyangiaceae bacterium]